MPSGCQYDAYAAGVETLYGSVVFRADRQVVAEQGAVKVYGDGFEWMEFVGKWHERVVLRSQETGVRGESDSCVSGICGWLVIRLDEAFEAVVDVC